MVGNADPERSFFGNQVSRYAARLGQNQRQRLVRHFVQLPRYVRYFLDIKRHLFGVIQQYEPLTLILPGACAVAENLIPEEGTLGIRIPEHEFCKKLIRKLNRPLVSTSANISGQPAPRTYSEISQDIRQGVDLIVDPSLEGHPTRKASSIIRVGLSGEVNVIRP